MTIICSGKTALSDTNSNHRRSPTGFILDSLHANSSQTLPSKNHYMYNWEWSRQPRQVVEGQARAFAEGLRKLREVGCQRDGHWRQGKTAGEQTICCIHTMLSTCVTHSYSFRASLQHRWKKCVVLMTQVLRLFYLWGGDALLMSPICYCGNHSKSPGSTATVDI